MALAAGIHWNERGFFPRDPHLVGCRNHYYEDVAPWQCGSFVCPHILNVGTQQFYKKEYSANTLKYAHTGGLPLFILNGKLLPTPVK